MSSLHRLGLGEDASACGGFDVCGTSELVHFSDQTQMMLVPGAWDSPMCGVERLKN